MPPKRFGFDGCRSKEIRGALKSKAVFIQIFRLIFGKLVQVGFAVGQRIGGNAQARLDFIARQVHFVERLCLFRLIHESINQPNRIIQIGVVRDDLVSGQADVPHLIDRHVLLDFRMLRPVVHRLPSLTAKPRDVHQGRHAARRSLGLARLDRDRNRRAIRPRQNHRPIGESNILRRHIQHAAGHRQTDLRVNLIFVCEQHRRDAHDTICGETVVHKSRGDCGGTEFRQRRNINFIDVQQRRLTRVPRL